MFTLEQAYIVKRFLAGLDKFNDADQLFAFEDNSLKAAYLIRVIEEIVGMPCSIDTIMFDNECTRRGFKYWHDYVSWWLEVIGPTGYEGLVIS